MFYGLNKSCALHIVQRRQYSVCYKDLKKKELSRLAGRHFRQIFLASRRVSGNDAISIPIDSKQKNKKTNCDSRLSTRVPVSFSDLRTHISTLAHTLIHTHSHAQKQKDCHHQKSLCMPRTSGWQPMRGRVDWVSGEEVASLHSGLKLSELDEINS